MTTQDRFWVRELIILVVTMLSLLNCRAQRKYYFSHKSTTEGNGSKLHPFSSLEKFSQLTLLPGDSIFFHAGDTIVGNIVLNNIRGSRNQNIVFTSYGKGRCVLNGINKEAITITSSSYFQILNLVITGSGRKPGIRLTD